MRLMVMSVLFGIVLNCGEVVFHAPALKSHLMQAASWEEDVILIRQLSLSEAVLQDA